MRLSNRQFNLLCATALMAIAAHLARLPWWLATSLLVIAPLRMLQRRRGGARISAWLRVPLVFALLLAITLQFGNIFGREPGSALACGLLMLKLIESETIRDARAGLGFSAFVLMSALLFTQTFGFTLMLCASLILLLAALNSLEPAPLDTRKPLSAELRTGARLLALGLPLAIAAFLFVPRLGAPLWGSPGGSLDARTGLDDQMSPGSMTDLLIDDSPALRVDFVGEPPANPARYFRAIVLWDFDGRTWTRKPGLLQGPAEDVRSSDTPIVYEITLEPTQRPWLVALDVPLQAPANLHMSNDRALFARERIGDLRQYRARSVIRYELAGELAERDRKRALDLPNGFDPKTHALASQWRGAGQSDAAIVQSALALFEASFTYTLSPPLLGRNSVDEFLFDTKAGFCEHYSSAFVVLMRAAGIPARVVTGYQGGWWNALGNYLLVRQSDAHAWAEVWLHGRGWVRVDPTAAVNPARVEGRASADSEAQNWSPGSWLLGMRNRLDLINRLWTQSIVQFNALRQKSLLSPFGISEAEQEDLLLALGSAIAVILLLATAWVLHSGTAQRVDALDASWNRLRARLGRRGLVSRTAEGPFDFMARTRHRIEEPDVQQRLEQLVHAYVTLRYAVIEPDPAAVSAFAKAVGEFHLPRAVRVRD